VLRCDSCRAVNRTVQHRVGWPCIGLQTQKHILILTARQATTSTCTGSFWRPVPPPEVQAQVKGCSTYEKLQKAGCAMHAQLHTISPPTGCSPPPWLCQWPLPPGANNMNQTGRALLRSFSRPCNLHQLLAILTWQTRQTPHTVVCTKQPVHLALRARHPTLQAGKD
jgi:hypothetical protein